MEGGTVCATLADSFWPEEVPMPATVIENAVGKGRVICLTATDYAGKDEIYPLYRLIVRELLRAIGEDPLVQTCSEVRYARYGEDVVYLLNTSYDMPAIAVIDPLHRAETVTLAPMELRKLRVTKEKIETLCSM